MENEPASDIARHWIDGAWVSSDKISESLNPSTGGVLGRYADGGAWEAQAAITAARRAFDNTSWASDRQARAAALSELAQRLEERSERVAHSLAQELGKVLNQARMEAALSPFTLRHNAGTAMAQTGSTAELAPGLQATTWREAIGVAGIIVPWNAPIALLVRALAPALAAGCTVVVKMPGQTALTNAIFSEAVAATKSLPPGVVNIFTESGNEGAPLLVSSPDVDAINYTGSTKVGRVIAAQGAETLKRLSLELGGKTPLVVFEDADIDIVAPQVVQALVQFNGEFCISGSRVLVQESVAGAYRKRLTTLLSAVRIGPADSETSQLGPLVDMAAVERVKHFIAEARTYATVLVEGGRPTEPELANGAFLKPYMLEVRDTNVPLVQQEIFAPVLSFETFSDEADAIAKANATEYGLAAAVFTKDIDRAALVVRRLKAGTVWTNAWGILSDTVEEGGFKSSGIGRARGARAVEEFQEIKTHFLVYKV
ncbi:aldehyde dehydrogenase family protein [Rhizobium lusitanum]|uniref:aldehyde dehydrogenase family protein n=1 Tax=Rhizobium lusitanum TaxID=293958 RepID=UPI00195CA90B|nr:aldehyde dehydrogenase family protein [Rhizobium lusitanum]MBM7045688.1 aldehyde dehydrogenase family protein [Rhizobium lusitanum]